MFCPPPLLRRCKALDVPALGGVFGRIWEGRAQGVFSLTAAIERGTSKPANARADARCPAPGSKGRAVAPLPGLRQQLSTQKIAEPGEPRAT